MGRESLPFPRVLKKALFFPSCEKRNWKKSLFFSQIMCHFSLFYKWKTIFYSCKKRNWEKSLFFLHMRREIEKSFFPSLMWEGKGRGIPPLFPPLNDYPDKKFSIVFIELNWLTKLKSRFLNLHRLFFLFFVFFLNEVFNFEFL